MSELPSALAEALWELLAAPRLDAKLAPLPAGPLRAPAALRERAAALALPGRPEALRILQRGEARSPFPKATELREAEGRARALHFFANHELLAIEALAWALLAFPEADEAWRADQLETLAEEQLHLGLYIARMEELGLGFGELPVNGHIWERARDHDRPERFSAYFSIALEGGNLDFAADYMARFEALEDSASAALMRRILADEIQHVRRGVAAFQRAGVADEELFEAWSRELVWPMTPARSRGPQVHRRSRLAAGLPESFIARLAATSRRRGERRSTERGA